ncbi:HTH-type transcriptional regulator YfmP [Marinithermofilum abyssi]|uniref:HTH-type transcriptional regulator YfmP n=1 Tax=Marinithermofilum abyssi TaxID=1571185 RepID=A0A8J2VHM8_9BACL|nr:MerR family transcriptional regulator [Marinithermofilum abyssi]GGE23729.1 HTH-type transcriptional regulator YfmP [Marinithermofilum abyssi]
MEYYKIDEVARKTGLTKRAIRYYEEIGLFQPAKRSEGGIRLYTDEDIQQLKRMSEIREVLGFSLQEIRRFMELTEELEAHRRGYRQSDVPEKQVEELKEIRDTVTRQLDMIRYRMKKMTQFKQELEELLDRVNKGLARRENQ